MKNILLLSSVLLMLFLTSCEKDDFTESNGSTQCHAKTQKGKRCKRMVADGGYYCWQHR